MTNDNTKPLPPLTPAEIAELRLLEAAATELPWHLSKGGNIVQTSHITRDVWVIPHCEPDMPFIIAIRNAAPRLLAAAEREQKLRELLSQARDDSVDCLNDMLERKLDTYRPKSVEAQRQFIADIDAALAETEVQK